MSTKEGTCPVCDGSTRKPAGDSKYKHIISGYDKETDTFQCDNCGGQYMWGRAIGKVRLQQDGTPCTHKYTGKTVGRCLTQYTCMHCNDQYQIDSGD